MSDAASQVRDALVRPADASYGSALRRRTAAAFVGVAAGVLAAMGTHVFRLASLAPGWVSTDLMVGVILASGGLVKLLCQNLRVSVGALGVACAVSSVAAAGFAVAPYYLLGVSTMGGWVLLPVLRDVVSFALIYQIPLQIAGYLTAVVYDGFTA